MTNNRSGCQWKLSSMPNKHRRFNYKKPSLVFFFYNSPYSSTTNCGLLSRDIACFLFFSSLTSSCFYYEQILLSIAFVRACTPVCTRSRRMFGKNKWQERQGSFNAKYCFTILSIFLLLLLLLLLFFVPDVRKLIRCCRQKKKRTERESL